MGFKLKSDFKPTGDQPEAIAKLVENLEKGAKHQVLLGVTGSGKTFTMANVIAKINKPTLVISHNKTLAAQLYQEYKQFFPDNMVAYFVSYYDYYQPEAYLPATDTYIDKDASINEEIDKFRLSATTALLTRQDVIIVASVSCIYNIGSPVEYKRSFLRLKVGLPISQDQLITRLLHLFYERNDYDFKRGGFRVRGEVIDLWPAYMDTGIRLELNNNQLTNIWLFDPVSGRILDQKAIDALDDSIALDTWQQLTNFHQVVIYPAKHYITDQDKRQSAIKAIKRDLKKQLKFLNQQGKTIEAYRLEKRTMYDLEMIEEIGYCKGIENYSIYFDGRSANDPPNTLIDFFPDDFLTIIDESHITVPQIRGMYEGDRSRKQTLIDYGFRLPSALDNRPLKFDEFLNKVDKIIYTSATPSDWEIDKAEKDAKRLSLAAGVVEQLIRPTGLVDPAIEVRPIKNQIPDLIKEIKETVKQKQRVLVTTLTKRMAEDLADYLAKEEIQTAYLHSDINTLDRVEILTDLRKGSYDVVVGVNLLREGLDLPEVSLVAILDADKEGFLRSRTSLIQTMGRAARHIKGRVIMYAERITGSMKAAIDEVNRRRQRQIEYNQRHDITPVGINKPIREAMSQKGEEENDKGDYRSLDLAQLGIRPGRYTSKDRLIKVLETKMHQAAKRLDFELAAKIRDEIRKLNSKSKIRSSKQNLNSKY